MNKEQAVAKVLTIARDEVGYREKNSSAGLDDKTANAGSGNYTKYARDLDAIPGFYNGPKQGFAWCDVFYDWLLVKAFGAAMAKKLLCQPDYSAGAGCLYSAQYYRQQGRFFTRPEVGDQIFFTYQSGEVSHTGIVEAITGGTVTTIEGNTSDGVFRRSYQIGAGQIYGYGSPDWSLVADQEADEDPGVAADQEDEADAEPQATCQVTLPELREGDTGTPVERAQTLMIARGYYCGGRLYGGRETPDGEFGPSTEIAVEDLQLANKLKQDGVIGQDTWTALLTK